VGLRPVYCSPSGLLVDHNQSGYNSTRCSMAAHMGFLLAIRLSLRFALAGSRLFFARMAFQRTW
jgi:hypothetical protein